MAKFIKDNSLKSRRSFKRERTIKEEPVVVTKLEGEFTLPRKTQEMSRLIELFKGDIAMAEKAYYFNS